MSKFLRNIKESLEEIENIQIINIALLFLGTICGFFGGNPAVGFIGIMFIYIYVSGLLQEKFNKTISDYTNLIKDTQIETSELTLKALKGLTLRLNQMEDRINELEAIINDSKYGIDTNVDIDRVFKDDFGGEQDSNRKS